MSIDEKKLLETPYLTRDAKILILLLEKPRKYYDLQKMGFSSSVIYRVIKDFIQKDLVTEDSQKTISLTDKGKQEAKKLLICFKNL